VQVYLPLGHAHPHAHALPVGRHAALRQHLARDIDGDALRPEQFVAAVAEPERSLLGFGRIDLEGHRHVARLLLIHVQHGRVEPVSERAVHEQVDGHGGRITNTFAHALDVVERLEQAVEAEGRALQVLHAIALGELLVDADGVGTLADALGAVDVKVTDRGGVDVVELVVGRQRLVRADGLAPEDRVHPALLPVSAELLVALDLVDVAELLVERVAFEQELAPLVVLLRAAHRGAGGLHPEGHVLPVRVGRSLVAELLVVRLVVGAPPDQTGGHVHEAVRIEERASVARGEHEHASAIAVVGAGVDLIRGAHRGAAVGQAGDEHKLVRLERAGVERDAVGRFDRDLPAAARGRDAAGELPVFVVDGRILTGEDEGCDLHQAAVHAVGVDLLGEVHAVGAEEVVEAVLDGLAHLDFEVRLKQGAEDLVIPGRHERGRELVFRQRLGVTEGDCAALADVGRNGRSAFRE